MSDDVAGLERLLPFLRDAVGQQPSHIADQLDAALRDGRTALEFVERDQDVFALVTVDGNAVCEVDIRNLLDDL